MRSRGTGFKYTNAEGRRFVKTVGGGEGGYIAHSSRTPGRKSEFRTRAWSFSTLPWVSH